MSDVEQLVEQIDASFRLSEDAIQRHTANVRPREMGVVTSVGRGVAHVRGLSSAQANELLRFPHDLLGIAFDLNADDIGVVMLDSAEMLLAGHEVRCTGRVLDVPVGDEMLGRVVDPVGRPLDGRGPVETRHRLPCEREAPPIMDRAAVRRPLQTGIKVIDALVPVGRGQRELILGDRQTGKTAIAIDTILNQVDNDVVCIYCSIGQRSTTVARIVDELTRYDAMNRCVIVVGESQMPPGLQFVAPYAATSIGEYFMEQGRDVLVVYDELGVHARAYREMSLLLRRPPGREAFPGDIFYVHSRLLERATHLSNERGGGSLTALPIIETEAQNVSAYIPTNLISITDGQIYLSPDRFQKGVIPAVDVGRSVSRVGGKTQLSAYRKVAGSLRLAYTQFEELEKFARFSSQFDDDTQQTLDRGRRVRELLKQSLHATLSVPEQIAILVSVTGGLFDKLPINKLAAAEFALRARVVTALPEVCQRIIADDPLDEKDIAAIHAVGRDVIQSLLEGGTDHEHG